MGFLWNSPWQKQLKDLERKLQTLQLQAVKDCPTRQLNPWERETCTKTRMQRQGTENQIERLKSQHQIGYGARKAAARSLQGYRNRAQARGGLFWGQQ